VVSKPVSTGTGPSGAQNDKCQTEFHGKPRRIRRDRLKLDDPIFGSPFNELVAAVRWGQGARERGETLRNPANRIKTPRISAIMITSFPAMLYAVRCGNLQDVAEVRLLGARTQDLRIKRKRFTLF
jgi:hypothetical protein